MQTYQKVKLLFHQSSEYFLNGLEIIGHNNSCGPEERDVCSSLKLVLSTLVTPKYTME